MITNIKRRSFLKVAATLGGGFTLGIAWASDVKTGFIKTAAEDWTGINAYLSISPTGKITIMSTNPEIGQNIKTAFPMIVADELGADWKDVIVEQAALDTVNFKRQVAGGSQSIRFSFDLLRQAGATARQMLINAAAETWGVDPSLCKAEMSKVVYNGKSLSYGELANKAGKMPKPENVSLKDTKDFHIIGSSQKNVDADKILSGNQKYGIDTKREGMLYASIKKPDGFGQVIVSVDDAKTRAIPGVVDVVQFDEKVVVLAKDTWTAMKGKKALSVTYKSDKTLEDSEVIDKKLVELLNGVGEVKRNDGDVDKAFSEADQIVEKTYEAPFLPHNCMEPMNFFADVQADKAHLEGPIQTPEGSRKAVADMLGLKEDQVSLMLTRMGGGFGRRLNGDFVREAAQISKLAGKPILLVYSREDDMAGGIYRNAVKYRFKAAVKGGKMTAYQLHGAGVNSRNHCRENFFPAGAIDNYKVMSSNYESAVTCGPWRAPVTNFLACAEQSFLDEVAEACKKDAVDFRLEMLDYAIANNSTTKKDYDPVRFKAVLKLAADKSDWYNKSSNEFKGFSAYFSHNSYVAEVAHMKKVDGTPVLEKVTCAFDCGILINPLSALNQVEGGVVDGIGHAMYGNLTIKDGAAQQTNFNNYRMIRIAEAPKVVSHFIDSTEHPSGLGEPTLPPAGGALANAIYKATGKRIYKQPFVNEMEVDVLG